MRYSTKCSALLAILLISCSFISLISGLHNYYTVPSYGTVSYPDEPSDEPLDEPLYGVCTHPWVLRWSGEKDFQEMKELGVKYVRFDFVWQDFEPSNNSWTFDEYDGYVQKARKYGIEIIALLLAVPAWLIPTDVDPHQDQFTIPIGDDYEKFVSEFGQFTYTLVDHYRGNITYFEIWNEQNLYSFWKDEEATRNAPQGFDFNRGNATTKYVKLLKEAYVQAKSANPDCKIISGGLAQNDYVYVEEMYNSGVKGYFDFFGIHPYVWHSPTKNYDFDYVDWDSVSFAQFPKIKLVRDVMLANDDDRDMFITEIGVGGASGPEGETTEEMQANRTTRFFEIVQNYTYVFDVIWYQLRYSDAWALMRDDYSRKPMYYAFKEVIEGS